MLNLEQLKAVRSDLERKREQLREEMKNLPGGELYIIRRGENNYYCQRFPKKGNRKKEVRRGITRDKALLKGLVRKRYVKEAISVVDADLEVIRGALNYFKPSDEISIMREFMLKHPELMDYVYKDATDYSEWAANYERQKDFYDDDLTSVAGDRTMMRSRGEIIIAEKLRQNGIPFRYEAALNIPDLSYVPDFTIRRPFDGKIFYWEHFGDVTDVKYMKRNELKLERYEEYGIVPWNNLIITYDFMDGGVNVPLIEGMIHAWLL